MKLREKLRLAAGLARRYLLTTALLAIVAIKLISSIGEDTPSPQHPPMGQEIHRTKVQLEWQRGDMEGPARLLVSRDDPGFTNPLIDQELKTRRRNMAELEPGATYYWKLEAKGRESKVFRFRVAPTAMRYE